MNYRGCLFFLMSLALIAPCKADIYRCVGSVGETLYSSRPCGDSTVIDVGDATGRQSAQGLRPGERSWLVERERKRRGKPRSKRVPKSVNKETQAYRCRSKRRALDKVRAKLRRGYKPAAGERLRRQRSAHEDYLATFCS